MTSAIGKHKTQVIEHCGDTEVYFHNTCIIKFNDDFITLDSGGFRVDPDGGLTIQSLHDGEWSVETHADNMKEAKELLSDYQRCGQMIPYKIARDTINGSPGSGMTTRKRIEQVSSRYLLNLSIWQDKFKWYVGFNGKTLEFFDGMKINRDTGEVTNA